jgi:amidohydrolase
VSTALLAAIDAHLERVARLRHDLHRIPEPGYHETETAAYVADALRAVGLAPRTGVGGTGVVADLETDRDGRQVVLRADMDGLPVREATGVPYKSRREGYAHACGHDGHMAILLGVAGVLRERRERLAGRVRFLFQPAEEVAGGARAMIADGALDGMAPDAILALHGWPGLAADTVAARPGIMMASNDGFLVRVHGRGGHGARPDAARNPLPGLARAIEKLTALTRADRVVSVCLVQAGEKNNVIPSRGILEGTCRALSPAVREETREAIRTAAREACAGAGLQAEVLFQTGCPAVENDPGLFDLFRAVGGALAGRLRVETLEAPSMGSEDFSCFLEYGPGLLFRVGVGEACPQLHAPGFDFNDAALGTGMRMLASMVWRLCAREEEAP